MHMRVKQYVDPRSCGLRTRSRCGRAFRHDFATQEYGPGEIAMAKQLARLIEEANRAAGKSAAMWSIVTQWMDRLMLTPKGKRDARLMLGDGQGDEPPLAAGAELQAHKCQWRLSK